MFYICNMFYILQISLQPLQKKLGKGFVMHLTEKGTKMCNLLQLSVKAQL